MKIEPEVQQLFEASIVVHVGDGLQSFFWTDNWLDGETLINLAPKLILMVPPRIKKRRTVQQALHDWQWVRDITGGLSVLAIVEYLHLWVAWRAFNCSRSKPTLCASAGRRTTAIARVRHINYCITVVVHSAVQTSYGNHGRHFESSFSCG
jgi:hypothetical protein